jgi:outer membrane protein TolC
MLFQAARINYIESLLTQRDALETQVELTEIKKQELSAYVNLYKALGGGWRPVK